MISIATKKSRPITLIEVLLVLVLVMSISSFFAVRIFWNKEEKQFTDAIKKVEQQIQIAEEISLLLDTDVKIYFLKDDAGTTYFSQVERPLHPVAQKKVEKKRELKGIWVSHEEKEGDFTLGYLFGGSEMPTGTLKFFGKGGLERELHLPAYENDNGKDLFPFEVWNEEEKAPHTPS